MTPPFGARYRASRTPANYESKSGAFRSVIRPRADRSRLRHHSRGGAMKRMLAGLCAALLSALAYGQEPTPPKTLKAQETAIILVDFQANFTHPEGTWYNRFKPVYEKTKMLDRTVELVKAARAKGVWVIHVTEGYSQDYRELDWTNPGAFHRNQILRKAWKVGSKEAAYFDRLLPGDVGGHAEERLSVLVLRRRQRRVAQDGRGRSLG